MEAIIAIAICMEYILSSLYSLCRLVIVDLKMMIHFATLYTCNKTDSVSVICVASMDKNG